MPVTGKLAGAADLINGRVQAEAAAALGGDSAGRGCLPDRPAGHTVRYIQRTRAAPTSAPPNGSRRPVVVYTSHRHRTGTI